MIECGIVILEEREKKNDPPRLSPAGLVYIKRAISAKSPFSAAARALNSREPSGCKPSGH